MKKRYLFIVLLIQVASIASYFYLSLRSQAIQADTATEKSICQQGANWNCDVALTSPFAEIFNIPISHLGLSLQVICLTLLLMLYWNWLDRVRVWSNWIWRIHIGLALASICMLLISLTYLKILCPICTLCYILSWLILWPLKKTLPSSQIFSISKNEMNVHFKTGSFIAVAVACTTFLTEAFVERIYPIKEKQSLAYSRYIDWVENPKLSIPTQDLSPIVKGVSKKEARFVLVEFIDYLCSYCKSTHKSLNHFYSIHPDIRMELLHFPLNSRGCTKHVPLNESSLSCALAKMSYCAHQQDVGNLVADDLFEKQSIIARSSIDEVLKIIQNIIPSQKSFKKCLASSSTTQMISKQRELGNQLGIRGTPAIFINDKNITLHPVQLTLTQIYHSLK